jgi:hypothetical protein
MRIRKLKELLATGQFHRAVYRDPHLWIYKKSRGPGGKVVAIFHKDMPGYEEARLILAAAAIQLRHEFIVTPAKET